MSVTLFLGGDVMTGRALDQALPHPSDPRIQEGYLDDARAYVALAEERHGRFPRPIGYAHPWGDALAALERASPRVRIVNLETSITRSGDYWRSKGIHYRMHPDNVACLTAARIDVCALANNHLLDYGHAGLVETLETLERVGIATPGAGRDLDEARAPAMLRLDGAGRLIVLSLGSETSGVPAAWAATADRPGVNLLPDLSEATAAGVVERVRRCKRPGDVVVASIHWGSNWGYRVPSPQVRFAHRLIDGGVDLVHGHSSHHPRPVEVYRERLVLYGCGDLIDDYEGIDGHEAFRSDLVLAWFPTLEAGTGRLLGLRMAPFRMRRFRLERAAPDDARWLCAVLDEGSVRRHARVRLTAEGDLALGGA